MARRKGEQPHSQGRRCSLTWQQRSNAMARRIRASSNTVRSGAAPGPAGASARAGGASGERPFIGVEASEKQSAGRMNFAAGPASSTTAHRNGGDAWSLTGQDFGTDARREPLNATCCVGDHPKILSRGVEYAARRTAGAALRVPVRLVLGEPARCTRHPPARPCSRRITLVLYSSRKYVIYGEYSSKIHIYRLPYRGSQHHSVFPPECSPSSAGTGMPSMRLQGSQRGM